MAFSCKECGFPDGYMKLSSLLVCHQDHEKSFSELKNLLICLECAQKHSQCRTHHQAVRVMRASLDKKCNKLIWDNIPLLGIMITEFGKKMYDKKQQIGFKHQEMTDEVEKQGNAIEESIIKLEKALQFEHEHQEFNKIVELLKDIFITEGEENKQNQGESSATVTNGSLESSVEGLRLNERLPPPSPPPPYQDTTLNQSTSNRESGSITRPVLKGENYIPLDESVNGHDGVDGGGWQRVVARPAHRSRSRGRQSVQYRDFSPGSCISTYKPEEQMETTKDQTRFQFNWDSPSYSEKEGRIYSLRILYVNVEHRDIGEKNNIIMLLTNQTPGPILISFGFYQPKGLRFFFPGSEISEPRKKYQVRNIGKIERKRKSLFYLIKLAFEILPSKETMVIIDFTDVAHLLKEWAENESSKLFPFVSMRAHDQIDGTGRFNYMNWTIRADLIQKKWIPRFDSRAPSDHPKWIQYYS